MKKGGLLIALTIAFSICSGSVLAGNTSQANTAGKDFANSMNNAKVKDAGKNIDPSTVPNYQGSNVPEASYYNSGLNIENQAQSEASTNPTAQFINDARTNRPQISINRDTDPLFMRHEEIKNKSHGLSETYSGCVDLPVGTKDVTQFEDKTCNVTGHQDTVNFTCKRTLSVTCSNPEAGQPDPFEDSDFTRSGDAGMGWGSSGHTFWYGNTGNNRHGDCKWFENTIRFYITDLNTIPEFVLEQVKYDDWMFVWVNGHVGFQGIGGSTYSGFDLGWKFPGNYKCEKKGVRTFNINLDARPKLRVGWNTIFIRHLVGGGGNAYLKFRARRLHGCTQSSSYTYTCPAGESHTKGTLKSSICTSGSATRYVKGFPVYRSCWEWDRNYSRLTDPYYVKDPMCGQLESEGCGQKSAVCTNHNGTYCENQVITYSCPYQTSARHVSMCGSQLVCPDGDCTSDYGQTYEPATDDFQRAATGMAVASEIAKDLDQDNLTVFTGEDQACAKKKWGFANCCKDSGWGTDIGLANCSNEEKELGLMKEAKRTHYIGNYCNDRDDILGCLSRKYVYCSYPSKLARIVIEQGKAQLGQNFGSAKNPNCSGFTVEQLETLNFDAMDLSEFYSDVMNNAANGSTPNSNGVAQDIQDKLKSRYPELNDGGN